MYNRVYRRVIHPKMKICLKCTHPQAIQDLDEFVSSSEQIWRNGVRSNGLRFQLLNYGFVSYKRTAFYFKTLFDGLELCGLLVDYCDVFLSCLDSHSDGTHSLQSIHWWASDVMLNFSICSAEETNSSTWPDRKYIFSKF